MIEQYRGFTETDTELMVLETVIEQGSGRKAAKYLGKSKSWVNGITAKIKQRYNDHHGISAPIGYVMKGTSTLKHLPNGDLRWEKTDISKAEQLELMRIAIEALREDVEPIEPELPLQNVGDESLCNMFLVTDYHMGMRAWPEETDNAPWDLSIATDLLVKWFTTAIRSAPQAKYAVFANLGDFLHWDGLEATTKSGNILEGDTRKRKMVRVAMKVLRRVTKLLLQTHEHVHLLMAEGNHDEDGSAFLAEHCAEIFEDEPRITVDKAAQPYYWYEHGKTSLFFHHGHKRGMKSLDTTFAGKFRKVYGRTDFSYAHVGHLHSDRLLETNLMTVEQHRTLASPDSYATRGGWVSGRSAKVITYHKEYGEVGRITITPEMVG